MGHLLLAYHNCTWPGMVHAGREALLTVVVFAERTADRGMKALRPTASGLGSEHGSV